MTGPVKSVGAAAQQSLLAGRRFPPRAASDTTPAQLSMRSRCVAYIEAMGLMCEMDSQTRGLAPIFKKLAAGMADIEPKQF